MKGGNSENGITNLFSVLYIHTWKPSEKNGYARNGMHTYGSGINPTDLRLEFCKAHEQNYINLPPVTP